MRLMLPMVCVIALFGLACGTEPPPVVVERERITVFNGSIAAWSDVQVRVNQYYVIEVRDLPSGGRLDIPVRRLQGGFGRYFDPARERVRRVDVSARASNGAPVRLAWQADRAR